VTNSFPALIDEAEEGVGGKGTEAAAAAAEPAGAGEEELEEEAEEDARTTCLPAVVSIVMMPSLTILHSCGLAASRLRDSALGP